MNRSIFAATIILLVGTWFSNQPAQAQGTVYLSNLEQTPIGSSAAASNSWLATDFFTGNNASGYMLNSIQLGMADASGSPSGFTAMLYANSNPATISPGSSLETLNGSLNPVTSGTYTYTPASNFILSPSTLYFIVLTAETTVANGAYEWNLANTYSHNPSDGWSGGGDVFSSSNGSSWNRPIIGYFQYSLNATPVPEPSAWSLIFLGGGVLIYARKPQRHTTRQG